jgi:hypothetical protein
MTVDFDGDRELDVLGTPVNRVPAARTANEVLADSDAR